MTNPFIAAVDSGIARDDVRKMATIVKCSHHSGDDIWMGCRLLSSLGQGDMAPYFNGKCFAKYVDQRDGLVYDLDALREYAWEYLEQGDAILAIR